MGRTPREVWEKRVERLRESELTDGEFAAEIGVNLHTLRSWKWKLAAEVRGADRTQRTPSAPRDERRRSTEAKATFVEMAIAPAVGIELRVGGVEVRVPVGFDEQTLSRVVAVLRLAS